MDSRLDQNRTAPAPPASTAAGRLRLLLLHPDTARREALLTALTDEGYAAAGAACGEGARLCLAANGPPDALLVAAARDGSLPGLAFARACGAQFPHLPVLYLTPLPWPPSLPLGAHERLLRGPFDAATLAAALAAALAAVVPR